jgi:enolase
MSLFRYVGGVSANILPVPMMNIINGGSHSDAPIAFQEFMVMPVKADSFSGALKMGTEIFHHLKKVLHDRGLSTAVGDEGGFAPVLDGTEDALDTITKAVTQAGYIMGEEVMIALDCASAEFYVDGKYDYSKFEGPGGAVRSSAEQADYLASLCDKYPIISIEDGMDENDWEGWKLLTDKVGDRVQLVGDDLFVTNVERLSRGIREGIANSILIIRNVPPFRGNRRQHHCRSCCCPQYRPDQNWLCFTERPDGQIQPVAPHRGGTGFGSTFPWGRGF